MKSVNIICPVYNEAQGIRTFNEELWKSLRQEKNFDFTVTYVADKCTDETWTRLKEFTQTNSQIRVLFLSSRFGHQAALVAGMDHTTADAVVMMDSDLQHPPEVISKLLEKFEEGFDVVYTIRHESEDVGFFRKYASNLFYRVLNRLSDVPIPAHAADFRLVSASVVQVFKTQIREHNPFLRGLFHWVGFRQTGVHFQAKPRRSGESKYSLPRLMHFAVAGIFSFSKKPLRISIYLGVIFAIFGFAFAGFVIVDWMRKGNYPPGWLTLTVLLCFFSGAQLVSIGILGEYFGLMFDEARNRPLYIVEEKLNL